MLENIKDIPTELNNSFNATIASSANIDFKM